MENQGSKKKITRVEGGEDQVSSTGSTFVASEESKGRAKQLRLFAMLAWIVAIGLQAFAIFKLLQPPVNMTWLIVVIVINLALALVGSTLWKKSNRLDPASEKEGFKFFVQNQLGAIMGVLAFLPLVIMILLNKDMSGKQKGIAGGIAAIALLIAGISGIDFNPPSVEQYTEQIQQVEGLSGSNHVYWTKSGKVYHLDADCHAINTSRTDEIFEGNVEKARELKNITSLCSFCEKRAQKEEETGSSAPSVEETEVPAEAEGTLENKVSAE